MSADEMLAEKDKIIERLRKALQAATRFRRAVENQPVKAVRILMITREAVEEYDRRIEELKKEKENDKDPKE